MDPKLFGQWEAVIPNDDLSASRGDNLGMQTVHSVLLPSGKVLFASGSSWRNFKNGTDVYPDNPKPNPYKGLYNNYTFDLNSSKYNLTQKYDKIFEYHSLNNNVGVYDPVLNTFFRIPHPVPEVNPDM